MPLPLYMYKHILLTHTHSQIVCTHTLTHTNVSIINVGTLRQGGARGLREGPEEGEGGARGGRRRILR